MNFTKRNDLFAGVDSDGTVFDSMRIKHTFSFIPTAVDIFGLESYRDDFFNIAERINLYSLTRGVNRFPGLLMTFEELEETTAFNGFGDKSFKEYIESGYPFSNDGLKHYISSHPSDFLNKVLEWSRTSDGVFKRLCEDIKPFEAVHKTLEHLRKYADTAVISAASGGGLLADWTNAGLNKSVDFIAGQELGNKSEQLKFAAQKGYSKMLMIGDAPGDYDAAKSVGASFYPIIPGRENECWELLDKKYADMFFENRYDEETENELYGKFIGFLKGEQL